MAKYITLDKLDGSSTDNGLKYFLSKLKNGSFVASSSAFGGIKIGYTQTGKNYPVQLSNGQAYVNVPWVNTTYNSTNKGLIFEFNSSSNLYTFYPKLNNSDIINQASIKIGSNETTQNNGYVIQLDKNGVLASYIPWTNNSVIYVNKHYKPSGTSQSKSSGIYKLKIDAAGHCYSSVKVTADDLLSIAPDIKSDPVSEEISYATLKLNRDNGLLIPGRAYRITDYVAQVYTSYASVSNTGKFDIIIEALNENTLSEVVKVCEHSGDTYFSTCNLDMWEVRYCIDNDNTRFNWVHNTNGKGVIYYMKDEWGNEAPYDFKHIKVKKSSGPSRWLFENADGEDASIKGYTSSIFPTNNIIKSYIYNGIYGLPRVNIVGGNNDYSYPVDASNNYIGYNSDGIYISHSSNNIIEDNCSEITIPGGSSYNKFGRYCSNTTLSKNCHHNVFFDHSHAELLGNNSTYNIFGFYSSCIFGSHSSGLESLGNDCHHNTFMHNCCADYFRFGNNCSYNIIADPIGHSDDTGVYIGQWSGSTTVDLKPISGMINCTFKHYSQKLVIQDLLYNGGSWDENNGGFYYDNNWNEKYDAYKFQNMEIVNILDINNVGYNGYISLNNQTLNHFNRNYITTITTNNIASGIKSYGTKSKYN